MRSLLGILFLVGISLAHEPTSMVEWVVKEVVQQTYPLLDLLEKLNHPQVINTLRFVSDNDDDLILCQDAMVDLSSCTALKADIEQMKAYAEEVEKDFSDLDTDLNTIVSKLQICSTESIFKQLSCYSKAFNLVKAVIKEYSAEFKEVVDDAIGELGQIEKDLPTCLNVTSTFSQHTLISQLALCKLKMAQH